MTQALNHVPSYNIGRLLQCSERFSQKLIKMNTKIVARNSMIFLAVVTAIVIPVAFFVNPMAGILSQKDKTIFSNQLYIPSFYIHVVLGGAALLIGWTGFVAKIRERYPGFHRIAGRIYVISFMITAISSVLVSFHATGGYISKSGFMAVGLIALFTTYKGFMAILNRKVKEHQAWMRYSYACCLASVTLRIWMPLLGIILQDGLLTYKIVAWLSWVPNLLFVKIFLNKK